MCCEGKCHKICLHSRVIDYIKRKDVELVLERVVRKVCYETFLLMIMKAEILKETDMYETQGEPHPLT